MDCYTLLRSLIEAIRLPDTTADQTAELLATGIHPAQELLLDFPRLATALDVLLQRGLSEVSRPAVIDKIQYSVELTLAATYAPHTVGDSLKFYEVFLQELLRLICRYAVARLNAFRVAVSYSPHTHGVLVGRQPATFRALQV